MIPFSRRAVRLLHTIAGSPYLLLDTFSQDIAAGSLNGTFPDVGPSRVENGSMSTSGGRLSGNGSFGSMVYGGQLSATTIIAKCSAASLIRSGWSGNPWVSANRVVFYNEVGTGDMRVLYGSPGYLVAHPFQSGDYITALVRVDDHAYSFIKVGTDNWKLLALHIRSTFDDYAHVFAYTATDFVDYVCVPKELWAPTPAVADTFTDTGEPDGNEWLDDPGFELGGTSWQDYGVVVSRGQSQTQVRSGSWAHRIETNATSRGIYATPQDLDEGWYEWSAWVYIESGDKVGLRILSGVGGWQQNIIVDSTSQTGAWQQIKLVGYNNGLVKDGNVYVMSRTATSTVYYVDDCQVQKVSNFLTDGGTFTGIEAGGDGLANNKSTWSNTGTFGANWPGADNADLIRAYNIGSGSQLAKVSMVIASGESAGVCVCVDHDDFRNAVMVWHNGISTVTIDQYINGALSSTIATGSATYSSGAEMQVRVIDAGDGSADIYVMYNDTDVFADYVNVPNAYWPGVHDSGFARCHGVYSSGIVLDGVSAEFDGVSSYADIYSSNLQGIFDMDEGTVIADWSWTGGARAFQAIASLYADANNGIKLGSNDSGGCRFSRIGAATNIQVDGPASQASGIAIGTYSVGQDAIAIYTDGTGTPDGSGTGLSAATVGTLGSDTTLIGAQSKAGQNPWDGKIGPVIYGADYVNGSTAASLYAKIAADTLTAADLDTAFPSGWAWWKLNETDRNSWAGLFSDHQSNEFRVFSVHRVDGYDDTINGWLPE